jgi:tetratricopeptide (TPR) repeat protein
MTVSMKLLGRPRVLLDGAWQDAPQEKPFWLLAYLICAEAWVEREKLGFLFWPDVEERKARVNLRQLIKRARAYPFAGELEVGAKALRWPVHSDFSAFRQALGRGDWAAAVAHYGGELLSGLSVSGGSGLETWLELERAVSYARDAKERNDIQVRLAGSYREAGRYAESQTLLDEVLKEALQPRTRAGALLEQAWLHLNFTKLEDAAAAAAEAAAIATGLGDASLELDLAKLRSNIAFRSGRYEASCAILEPAVARLRQEPPGRDLAGLLTSIGAAYDSLGRFDDALPLHRESLTIAQAIGSHYYQVDAASNLLHCLRRLRRAEEGLAAAEAALQLGRYQGSDYLRHSLALAYASLGRSNEATLLDEQLAHQSENPLLGILALTRLARNFYDTDRELEASHALGEAIHRLPTVEVAFARAGVVILALQRGSSGQKASVKPYLQPLLDGVLADELRRELEQAL